MNMQSRLQSSLSSDYAKSTSTFFSNILTQGTAKYQTLRRQLISSDADGDTEDDSHVARALRAYYTEKGRGLPEWLPVDPKAPVPVQQAPQVMVSSQGGGGGYGQQGQMQGGAGGQRWGAGRAGGGLSDLWGDSSGQQAAPASASLRPGRPGMMQSNSSQGSLPSQGSGTPVGGGRFGNRLQASNTGGSFGSHEEIQGRPLPSQRAGSYQSQSSMGSQGRFDTASPPGSSGGGGTAQDRLKARLWGGGRTASPPPASSSAPPPSSSNPYASSGGGGRSSAGSGGNPYAQPSGGGGGRSGMTSSNSPWSSSGSDPYAGGVGGGGGGGGYGSSGGYGGGGTMGEASARTGGGLPSGPRAGRQGFGLPSGPRPQGGGGRY